MNMLTRAMLSRSAEAGGARSSAPASLHAAGRVVPGLAVSAVIAVVAWIAAPMTPFPAVLLALAGGLLLSPVGQSPLLQPGIATAVKPVMRAGVALLGAQITFAAMQDMGVAIALLATGVLALSLIAGLVLARRFGLSAELGWLTAGAVAICGASAALAIAAVLPKSKTIENNAAACVASITVFGTAAMLLYPVLAEAAGLGPRAAGAFLGASLHEVVQAVGAGFALSEDAGAVATTVKLMRVACLGPVILLVSWWSRSSGSGGARSERPPLVPGFLIVFALLMIASSLGAIPAPLSSLLAEVSRACLLTAIAALGLKVSGAKLAAFGWRPLLVLLLQSLIIGLLSIFGVYALGIQ